MRIISLPLWQATSDKILDQFSDPLWFFLLYVEEVSFAIINLRPFTGVDPVRVGDNEALSGLPIDLGKSRHRHHTRDDDIAHHGPRSDRWQLIHVSHQDQSSFVRDGPQQRMHERDIYHRTFIDDHRLRLERIVPIATEPTLCGREFE